MSEDVANAQHRDPAARSKLEVFLTYSGIHAVWGYRVANALWRVGLRLPARIVSQLVRALTGVEIHPAATIGRRLFIDHGMGVVVGATAEIGDDVLIYHGVTLGGTTFNKGKRHPTIGDGVIIGTGAAILGPVTIGEHSLVGAHSVVVRDAPASSVLVGAPAVARARNTGATTIDGGVFEIDPAMYI